MAYHHRQPGAWEEIWARILAFREHLPNQYEVEERIVKQYHAILEEMESEADVDLEKFRVQPEDIRPKLISVSTGTRHRPGRANYSDDNYCLRSALLMKLDAVIKFIEGRPPSVSTAEDGPLLPTERIALAIFRYAESIGIGQWRPTSVGELCNALDTNAALAVDRLVYLWEQGHIDLRKWSPEAQMFVFYNASQGFDENFFYRADFQLKVLPRGRPYFEKLAVREEQETTRLKNKGLGRQAGVRPENGLQVFLCHSSGDKDAVRDLHRKLKGDGFRPWLDEEDILPGQGWDSEIRRAVRGSHVVIVCLSKSSITREGYVQKEIKLALDVAEEKPENTIFLIPARLEDCEVPERLTGWHWVDLFVDKGYERLVSAL